MMDWMHEWIRGVMLATILISVAEQLTPAGISGKLCRLAGGAALTLVLLQPLSGAPWQSFSWDLSHWEGKRQQIETQLQQEQEGELKSNIEQTAEAYIWDKAQALGLDCTAQVEVRSTVDGAPVPYAVTVAGPYHAALADYLSEEMGIPSQRQQWLAAAEGGAP